MMKETDFRKAIKSALKKVSPDAKIIAMVAGFRTSYHVPDSVWVVPAADGVPGRTVFVEFKGASTKFRLGQRLFMEHCNTTTKANSCFLLRHSGEGLVGELFGGPGDESLGSYDFKDPGDIKSLLDVLRKGAHNT